MIILRWAKGRLRGLIATGRALHRRLQARNISRIRRLERVYPPDGERVVAMTFDDGPTAAEARPGSGRGITASIVEVMERYGATGTFNIIGSTGENYPDDPGKPHTPLWSGIRYDHYPEYGQDRLAGAENQPHLVDLLLKKGHELANHSYRHLIFGPSRVIYGHRACFDGFQEALEDAERLHQLICSRHGLNMTLARPPHYVDRTRDGRNSFDIYGMLGYHYLAASFDGGGWMPSSGDYSRDVRAMIRPLAQALGRDPSSLNGQIIFQKDGYNMSGESPVVDALPGQLDLLSRFGYRVVAVSELLSRSPFSDVPPSAPYFPDLLELEHRGHALGFQDNTFRPDRPLTWNHLVEMAAPTPDRRQISPGEAWNRARCWMPEDVRPSRTVTRSRLLDSLERLGTGGHPDPGTIPSARPLTRGEALPLVRRLADRLR